jgi:hypothetical protein
VFQSRSGFSPCLDAIKAASESIIGFVSIPFWVFSLPRRKEHRAKFVSLQEFQSRSGFSPCLDGLACDPAGPTGKFQSRSGFSPCLDCFDWAGRSGRKGFQSRSGFSPCLDSRPVARSQRLPVSIPFWVFSLPRPFGQQFAAAVTSSFNPVLGFLPASTRTS